LGGSVAASRVWVKSSRARLGDDHQRGAQHPVIEEIALLQDARHGIGLGVALDLADVQLYPTLYTHLDDRALARGATAYSLFARHFSDWFSGERKWLTALLKAWSEDPEHGESNRKVLNDIVDRWYPQACAAVRSIAEGVAESAGSTTVVAAADRAAAECAAELTKYGIRVPAAPGAGE